jgi:hypothetical protein
MPAYRLYDLDGAGKFSAAEWIDADDDASAADAARAWQDLPVRTLARPEIHRDD